MLNHTSLVKIYFFSVPGFLRQEISCLFSIAGCLLLHFRRGTFGTSVSNFSSWYRKSLFMAFFVVFAFTSLDAKRSDAFKNLAT